MIYVFDIDGTICTIVENAQYEKAKPYQKRIDIVNKLYKDGNVIKMFTARGSTTKIDWTALTKKQLSDWGLNYHELIMNSKPEGDIFIDDKAINSDSFFSTRND